MKFLCGLLTQHGSLYIGFKFFLVYLVFPKKYWYVVYEREFAYT